MGVKERRIREKESLRQEILDAARELFIEEGYESVSMRRIAEKIEYSPTTIYLYFQDKAELLNSICAETFERLVLRLERSRERFRDPIERMREGLREYVEFGLQNPQHYRVTFMVSHPQASNECNDAQAAGFRAYEHLRQSVVECIRAGRFRDVNVDVASQALWSGVHGVTSLLIANTKFPFVERNQLIDMVVDTLVQGLMV
ncbi:MAG: TetR/AcrR family transcriptional regulator [Candidatus Acidiferrales bacterium]